MKKETKKEEKSENEKFVELVKKGDFTSDIPPIVTDVSYLRLPSGSVYYFEPKEDLVVTGIRSFT
jgi:hypothetical protein